jgi:hypothetical protein
MRPCSWYQPPIKNPDKWPLEDDALIIKLQESGIRWEDVCENLPGRTPMGWPLHHLYLQQQREWAVPEDKLSRVYER